MLSLLAAIWINPSGHDSAAVSDAASTLASGRSADAAVAPPDGDALTAMFDAMSRAVANDHRVAFVEAAGSTPWARQTWRNIEALGVAEVHLRYRPAADPRSRPADVSVELAWTPAANSAYDGSTTVPRDVTFTVGVTSAGRPAVVDAGRTGDSWLPVWLTGDLQVTSLGEATVVRAGHEVVRPDVEVLTHQALAAVRTELAASTVNAERRVVVVAPASEQQAVGLGGPELDGAVATTTTVDGSPRAHAPVHVVLNPAEFERLTPRGAQVVLTHEVAHAVTGAAASAMPLWVAEGFADWVALRDVPVSLDVAAAQLLSSVRQEGLPAALPSDAEFAVHGSATLAYEAAWTAFRLLSRRAGDRAVLGFYADVRAGQPVATALEINAGLNVAELTQAWRTDLRRLARG